MNILVYGRGLVNLCLRLQRLFEYRLDYHNVSLIVWLSSEWLWSYIVHMQCITVLC